MWWSAAHGGVSLWVLGGSHLPRAAGGTGGTVPLANRHGRLAVSTLHKEVSLKVRCQQLLHPLVLNQDSPTLYRFVAAVTCHGGEGVDLSECGPFAFMAPQELCESHTRFGFNLEVRMSPPLCSGVHGQSNEGASFRCHKGGRWISEGRTVP